MILFCLFSLGVFAQSDSLTIKLKNLNTNKIEKKQVRNAELIEELNNTIRRKISLASLGGILFSVGLFGTIYYYNKPITVNNSRGSYGSSAPNSQYYLEVENKRKEIIVLSVFTGVNALFTIMNTLTIPSVLEKRNAAMKSVSLNFNSNGLSLAFKF